MVDNWANKVTFVCKTCMFFVPKASPNELTLVGRCRRHSPTMSGFPVVYETDWCGDHKLDVAKVATKQTTLCGCLED